MQMRSPERVALAIVAVGAAVSVVVFFGVRARQPSPPPLATASLHPRAMSTAEATAHAVEALEKLRGDLVRECWEPSYRKAKEPARIDVTFDMTFDATGRQVSRGISESRAAARPDVTACLGSRPLELRIPPPHATMRVQVPFSLP